MTDSLEPPVKLNEFLQSIDEDISNNICTLESLQRDSIAFIATIFALIGVIGLSVLKELMVFWVASSILLITLIFLKLWKDFIPYKKSTTGLENFFALLSDNERARIVLPMVAALIFNTVKPLYKSLILIFFTDLVIIFLSYSNLIQSANFGIYIMGFIFIILLVLIIMSLKLEQFGSFSMISMGQMAIQDKIQKSDSWKNFFIKFIKVIFLLFFIPIGILLFILSKINETIPFIDNFSNLCKIILMIIIQIIFIAIFCEFFNKQIASQIISKKIAQLNILKFGIITSSRTADSINGIINHYKSINLINLQRESSFFFFEKNSLVLNPAVIISSDENVLKILWNDELNYYLKS
jgi:hypothetical protein